MIQSGCAWGRKCSLWPCGFGEFSAAAVVPCLLSSFALVAEDSLTPSSSSRLQPHPPHTCLSDPLLALAPPPTYRATQQRQSRQMATPGQPGPSGAPLNDKRTATPTTCSSSSSSRNKRQLLALALLLLVAAVAPTTAAAASGPLGFVRGGIDVGVASRQRRPLVQAGAGKEGAAADDGEPPTAVVRAVHIARGVSGHRHTDRGGSTNQLTDPTTPCPTHRPTDR